MTVLYKWNAQRSSLIKSYIKQEGLLFIQQHVSINAVNEPENKNSGKSEAKKERGRGMGAAVSGKKEPEFG